MAELLCRFTKTKAEAFFKLDIIIKNHHQGDLFQTSTESVPKSFRYSYIKQCYGQKAIFSEYDKKL